MRFYSNTFLLFLKAGVYSAPANRGFGGGMQSAHVTTNANAPPSQVYSVALYLLILFHFKITSVPFQDLYRVEFDQISCLSLECLN